MTERTPAAFIAMLHAAFGAAVREKFRLVGVDNKDDVEELSQTVFLVAMRRERRIPRDLEAAGLSSRGVRSRYARSAVVKSPLSSALLRDRGRSRTRSMSHARPAGRVAPISPRFCPGDRRAAHRGRSLILAPVGIVEALYEIQCNSDA